MAEEKEKKESKRYYWIKLKTDFFSIDKIDFLLSQTNGCEYVVLYQMLCLKTANNNGQMSTPMGEIIVPYDVNKIVRDTKYFDFDTVTIALELFKKLGLIYEADNNVLQIANYTSMVGSESANYDAVKKREQRAKKKEEDIEKDKLRDKEGTNCLIEYRDKSIDNRDKEIKIQDRDKKEKEKKKTALSYINETIVDEKLRQALIDFLDFRKSIKSPMTEKAVKLLITQLKKISNNPNEQIEIINQSIMNGWKSVYPIKNDKDNNSNDVDFFTLSNGETTTNEFIAMMDEEVNGVKENE